VLVLMLDWIDSLPEDVGGKASPAMPLLLFVFEAEEAEGVVVVVPVAAWPEGVSATRFENFLDMGLWVS